MNRLIIALILVLFAVSGEISAQFNRLDPSTAAKVDSAVSAMMLQRRVVGCSVGLIRGGEVAWLKGYGLRDRNAQLPSTEHTIYRTASVAKTFSAIAAMQLVEQGKLDLQKNVREYVPEYPEKPQGPITTYRLLCHRSGIRHYEEYDTLAAINYEREHFRYDAVAAVDIFKDGSLLFQPGTAFSYTTFGYNLVGAAVERAGGQQFEEQLRERINRPLDLPYLQAEYQRLRPYPEETRGYHLASGSIVETPEDIGILFKVPGGGLLVSVVDLTLLMQGLAQYRLFADSATQHWMSLDHSGGSGFGIGIRTGTHHGRPYIWHNGGQQRTSTIWLCDPASGDGVAITSNTYATVYENFALGLLDVLSAAHLRGPAYEHIPHGLAVPELLGPPDNAGITADTAMLSWKEVAQGFRYSYEYSTDSLFTNALRDSTLNTTGSTGRLQPDSRYYWRVRTSNWYLYDGVVGEWSEVRTLTTSKVNSVTSALRPEQIDMYPNPTRGSVTITAGGTARLLEVTIHDLLGRRIAEYSVPHTRALTLQFDKSLPRTLLVQIRTEDGKTEFRRLTLL